MTLSTVVFMLLSTLLFSIMGASVKYLAAIPFLQIVFMRSVVSFIASVYTIKRSGKPLFGKKENFPVLLGRGIAGTIALSLYFYTLKVLNFSDAVTLQYLAPVFTAIIAAIALKERSSVLSWVSHPFAFLGVFIMYGMEFNASGGFLLAGLASAFFSGCAYVCISHLKHREDSNVIVFYFPLITIPIIGWPVIKGWVAPSPEEWLFLGVVGITTHFAQYFLTRAYQSKAKAGAVALLGYMNVVLACLIGYFGFGESLSGAQIAGMAIILLSVAVSTFGSELMSRIRPRTAKGFPPPQVEALAKDSATS